MTKKTKSLELLPGEGEQLLVRNERGRIAHLVGGLAELEALVAGLSETSSIADGILTDSYNNQIEATLEQLKELLTDK